MKRLLLLGVLALVACDPKAADTAAPATSATEAPAAPQAAATTAAQPSGPPKSIAAAEGDAAATVTRVEFLEHPGAKIFSTAGGDPAINGLYTYLALIDELSLGWKVYQIGDFNSWEIAEQPAGKVVLKVSRSWVEEATGDIKTADEKLIVDIPAFEANSTNVTPAT